ncbi:MAG: hypothetical protein Q8R86_10590, partial [Sulfuricurvum sp.]|nr:hypothetical protein [Sulfuricurvum sp.]
MSKILYTNCDLALDESTKTILVNPIGERFYFIPCEEQSYIFTNATLSTDEEGHYIIEGTQTLYNEHSGVSSSYEKLLCEHPAELIIKRTFLGLTWYKVNGIMKREVRSRYICQHKAYQIHERLEF